MAAQLHALDQRRLIDSNGIADGASIYFYSTGTTTPATIYSNAALSTTMTNPVVVAAGAAVPDIYLDSTVTYRRKIVYPDGTNDDTDPYTAPFVSIATLAATGGSAEVGHIAAGTGAIATTTQAKLRKIVHVTDYYSSGNYTAAFAAALTALSAGGTLIIPPKATAYEVDDELTLPSNIEIVGQGRPLIKQVTSGKRLFIGIDISNVTLRGFRAQGVGSATVFTSSASDGLINITSTTLGASNNVRIHDLEVYDAYTCIAATRVQNLWIGNNVIRNFLVYGILASSSYNFSIARNNIYSCDQTGAANAYGISATGNVAAGFPQQRNRIEANVIDGIPSWDGIMSHQVTNIVIFGNIISDVRCGIDLTTSDEIIGDCTISLNQITLTTTDTFAGAAALHQGILVTGESPAATVDGVIITGNIIIGANSMTGYAFGGNCRGAIGVENATNTMIADNIIRGMGNIDTSYSGVFVFKPGANVSVDNNTVSGSYDGYPITIQQSTGGSTCDNLSVTNNTAKSSGSPPYHLRLNTGAYTNLSVTDNVGYLTPIPYVLDGTTPTATIANGPLLFTPSLQFGGAAVGMTYVQQQGIIERRQNKVTEQIYIRLSAKGSSTGNATITGSPFTAASTLAYAAGTCFADALATITGPVMPVKQGTVAVMQLFQGPTGNASLTDANFTDTSILASTIEYVV